MTVTVVSDSNKQVRRQCVLFTGKHVAKLLATVPAYKLRIQAVRGFAREHAEVYPEGRP